MIPRTIWVAKATGKKSEKILAATALNNNDVASNAPYLGNSFI